MKTCDHCGGSIIFRKMNGVVTPIHLDGGFCGGTNDNSSTPKHHSLRYAEEDNFCRRTRCPHCDGHVFLIHHNRGYVWVDDLGWPWPKHPCFDKEAAETWRVLSKDPDHPGSARGAVVTRITFQDRARFCHVFVRPPNADAQLWLVRDIENPGNLLGALVVLCPASKRITLVDGTSYPIEEPVFACPICGIGMRLPDLDAHMQQEHRVVRCGQCNALVNREALKAHLQQHERELRARRRQAQQRVKRRIPAILPDPPAITSADKSGCPRGHGPMRLWEGSLRCWKCGWPLK